MAKLPRLGVCVLLLCLGAAATPGHAQQPRPHVLNIAIDDLRASVGAYGDPHAQTPHLDRFAAEGVLFERAYVQQAVCAASRASLLTGLRPTQTTVSYPYNDAFRGVISRENPTFPSWFEAHGAWSRMIGKIHHQDAAEIENNLDAPPISSRRPEGTWMDYAEPANAALARAFSQAGKQEKDALTPPPAYESAEVGDDGYVDGRNADLAVGFIREYAEAAAEAEAAGRSIDPLFLSVGFVKPHLPFNAPQRYWDLYDPAELPDHATPPPAGVPAYARATYELAGQYDTREAARDLPLPDDLARTLTHGYYACVSYVDAQVGEVLAALDEAGLAEDTVVVIWGDHGFHLGENGMWGKHVNHEVATRAPLLFRGPGVPAGVRVAAPVEFLGIYPTLCELTGLTPPGHLEGESLVPLMRDPGGPAAADRVAVSEYGRGEDLHGWSVRTATHRYVKWRHTKQGVIFRELYDHRTDPGEQRNLADEQPALADELADRLHAADPASRGPG